MTTLIRPITPLIQWESCVLCCLSCISCRAGILIDSFYCLWSHSMNVEVGVLEQFQELSTGLITASEQLTGLL